MLTERIHRAASRVVKSTRSMRPNSVEIGLLRQDALPWADPYILELIANLQREVKLQREAEVKLHREAQAKRLRRGLRFDKTDELEDASFDDLAGGFHGAAPPPGITDLAFGPTDNNDDSRSRRDNRQFAPRPR